MPYKITPAQDPQAIAERQIGSGPAIRFTPFDSCIGLLGRRGTQVTGLHLVMISGNALFSKQDASFAVGWLKAYPDDTPLDEVKVVGEVEAWKSSCKEAYEQLIKLLADTGAPVAVGPTGQGTYAAGVAGSQIQVTRA